MWKRKRDGAVGGDFCTREGAVRDFCKGEGAVGGHFCKREGAVGGHFCKREGAAGEFVRESV